MKNLFVRFEKETQIPSSLIRKNQPLIDVVRSRKYPDGKSVEVSVIAQISSAFNEYMNDLWNKNMTKGKCTWGRVNKFMVRKWVKQMSLVALLIFMFASCVEPAKTEIINSSNPNFEIHYLFEHDGCKLYRFYDAGRYIYYSDCRGNTEYTYHTGGKTPQSRKQQTLNN